MAISALSPAIARKRKRAQLLRRRREAYGHFGDEASEALHVLTRLHLPEVTEATINEVFGRFFRSANVVGMFADQKTVQKAFAYVSVFNLQLGHILRTRQQGAESDELARLCDAASAQLAPRIVQLKLAIQDDLKMKSIVTGTEGRPDVVRRIDTTTAGPLTIHGHESRG